MIYTTATAPPPSRRPGSVAGIMRQVLFALVPAIAVHAWLFGPAILIQLGLASLAALLTEAAALRLRGRPAGPALRDGSALLSAWLVALSLPPLVPWWLTLIAVAVAIVLAKQLYGGLGQNPFNPAMAAYCAMIVAFPAYMTQWPASDGLAAALQWRHLFGLPPQGGLDAFTGATVLDTLRTGLRVAGSDVASVRQAPAFGLAGGAGWELVGLAYLLGGVYLLWRGIIGWQLPVAFLATLALMSGAFWLADPHQHASPLFHLASGGTLLAAFFIVTDPVTSAATPRGKLLFGAGTALIAYLIRAFGMYPDGIAFAVLLMNLCVPLIDLNTRPPVFGHRRRSPP